MGGRREHVNIVSISKEKIGLKMRVFPQKQKPIAGIGPAMSSVVRGGGRSTETCAWQLVHHVKTKHLVGAFFCVQLPLGCGAPAPSSQKPTKISNKNTHTRN